MQLDFFFAFTVAGWTGYSCQRPSSCSVTKVTKIGIHSRIVLLCTSLARKDNL
jgi:hypothetical protein